MAQLIDTTVNGDLTVFGNIYDAGNEVSVSDRIDNIYDKFLNMICESYELPVTVTAGTNYTINNAGAVLIGTTLRLYVYATRSAAISGNVTNECVATLKITDNGKLSNFYNVTATNGSTGSVCSLYTGNLARDDDNVINIDIYIAATATSTTSFNSYINLPVKLNADAF